MTRYDEDALFIILEEMGISKILIGLTTVVSRKYNKVQYKNVDDIYFQYLDKLPLTGTRVNLPNNK